MISPWLSWLRFGVVVIGVPFALLVGAVKLVHRRPEAPAANLPYVSAPAANLSGSSVPTAALPDSSAPDSNVPVPIRAASTEMAPTDVALATPGLREPRWADPPPSHAPESRLAETPPPAAPTIEAPPQPAVAVSPTEPQGAVDQSVVAAFRRFVAADVVGRSRLPRPWTAQPPLTRAASEAWRDRLVAAFGEGWRDHQGPASGGRQQSVEANEHTLRFTLERRGRPGPDGWAAVILLHGGGNDSDVNDQAWEAVQTQYSVAGALVACPRSPVDVTESWIDRRSVELLDALVIDLINRFGADPNRISIVGTSMGGWGVLHLAPLWADRFAAASASAGGGFMERSRPENLYGLPLRIEIGTKDNEYHRYQLSKKYAEVLTAFARQAAGGYDVQFVAHGGQGHSIDDSGAAQWALGHVRNPRPHRIVWSQLGIQVPTNAWLADGSPGYGSTIVAEVRGNRITLERRNVSGLALRLDDALVDLEQPVVVTDGGIEVWNRRVERRVSVLAQTLLERGDPAMAFSAELALPGLD